MGERPFSESTRAAWMRTQLDAIAAPAPDIIAMLGARDYPAPPSERILERAAANAAMLARVAATWPGDDPLERLRRLDPSLLRRAVAAAGVIWTFGRHDASDQAVFDRAEFWRRGLLVGGVAERLAAAIGYSRPHVAFGAGLLNELGSIALAACAPRSLARGLREANERQLDADEILRHSLGVDRPGAGRHLAERWGLAPAIVDAIRFFDAPIERVPAAIESRDLLEVLSVARSLARRCADAALPSASTDAGAEFLTQAARLGIAAGECETALPEAECETGVLDPIVGLAELEDAPRYVLTLERAANSATRWRDEVTSLSAALSHATQLLDASQTFFAALPPQPGPRDVCMAGAAAVRIALDVPAALMFASSSDRHWYDVGASTSGASRGAVVPVADVDSEIESQEQAAAFEASHGRRLQPLGRAWRYLAERHRTELGADVRFMIPLVRGERFIGAVLIGADESARARLADRAHGGAALWTLLAHALDAASQRAIDRRHEEALLSHAVRPTDDADAGHDALHRALLEMASGASHELNTSLAIVSGRAQQLLDRATDDRVRAALAEIVENAHACSRTLEEFVEAADPGVPHPESIDLCDFLAAVRESWINAEALDDAEFRLELSDDSPRTVWADAAQLHRALDEIIRNALEATDAERRILTIKTWRHPTDELVVIDVVDNGRGMTPDVKRRACDPFFSFRPAGRGRGLGLARVLRWVRLNGGRLQLRSAPGSGTIVRMMLPSVAPA